MAIIAVVAVLWQAKQIILLILTSVVLASFIERPTTWLENHKIPRIVSVLFFYLIGFAIFGSILYVFVPLFFDELGSLVTLIPADSQAAVVIDFVKNGGFSLGVDGARQALPSLGGDISTGGLFQAISTFFGGVLNFVLVLVISFYLAIQKNGISHFLRLVTPIQYEGRVISIWKRTQAKIGDWFKGQLFVALIQFMLTFVVLTLIGMPYALSLALLSGILGIIPYGIVLATIPAVAVGYLFGGVKMGIIVMVLYFIFQQLENYIWQPVIIRRTTGVPSLMVLLSLIIGAKLAGVLGLILGMPVAVLLIELMRSYEERKLAQMKVSE